MHPIHKYYLTELGGERIVRVDGKKKLIKTGGYPIFKCKDCPSYVQRKLALGKKSICWVCETEMIMKAYNLLEVHPKHKECRKKRS